MGVGKTLTAIVLAGGIGVGGYFIGKGAGSDKEYGIKRDETGVYLQAKQAGQEYSIKKLEGQPYLDNTSEFQLYVFKTELTEEITGAVTDKFAAKGIEQKTSGK